MADGAISFSHAATREATGDPKGWETDATFGVCPDFTGAPEGSGTDPDQVNAAYISLLELGKRQVCLDTFMYLAKRLQMKPSDLMREIEARTGNR